MDVARAPHNAQARLKLALTPMWDGGMGHRLSIARMRQGRTQGEMAALLSTPGRPISRKRLAKLEGGRRMFLPVTWARLEAILGKHTGYVLIARDKALYDENRIRLRFHNYRFKHLRKNRSDFYKVRIPDKVR